LLGADLVQDERRQLQISAPHCSAQVLPAIAHFGALCYKQLFTTPTISWSALNINK
jgi:hypothetical protein